jgi:ribosome biogenesis GTPase A
MHATRKAIEERLPDIDVVIEMLDARLPGSSANPLLATLTQGKPALKVLNKQDLADAATTEAWLAHYRAQPGTQALGLDAGVAAPARALVGACRALVPLRGGMVKPVRVMICGVPNVGKSTLINTLAGQRKAKTGDEAGITKTEQKIVLASDCYLWDTPGMLWPRISVEESGDLLAAAGSVGRNAYDEEAVATALLARVQVRHPQALQARYKLDDAALAQPADALLAEIGRRRGALRSGGRLDLQKADEVVLNDFRGGAWGRVSLETPAEFAAWCAVAEQRDAERAARRALRDRRGARGAPRGEAPADTPDDTPADAPDDGAA